MMLSDDAYDLLEAYREELESAEEWSNDGLEVHFTYDRVVSIFYEEHERALWNFVGDWCEEVHGLPLLVVAGNNTLYGERIESPAAFKKWLVIAAWELLEEYGFEDGESEEDVPDDPPAVFPTDFM